MDDDIVTGSRTKVQAVKAEEKKEDKKKVANDLNNDGKFDKEDVSIAGKTLVASGKKAIKSVFGKKK